MKEDIARIFETSDSTSDAIEALCLYFTDYKKEVGREYRDENKVRLQKERKDRYDANPEKAKAASKKRYAENREQVLAYKVKNKAVILEKRKAHYKANPEKAKEASRKYYIENKEKVLAAQTVRNALNTARTNAKRLEKQLITTEP